MTNEKEENTLVYILQLNRQMDIRLFMNKNRRPKHKLKPEKKRKPNTQEQKTDMATCNYYHILENTNENDEEMISHKTDENTDEQNNQTKYNLSKPIPSTSKNYQIRLQHRMHEKKTLHKQERWCSSTSGNAIGRKNPLNSIRGIPECTKIE